MSDTALTIDPASREDLPLIREFIRELAEYEKLLDEVEVDEAQLEETLFGEAARAWVLIARLRGQAVGFAVYFFNYSTFLGKPGLYLEDIFVRPQFRGHGVGRGLMKRCAEIAQANDCGRMEWSVLDWNEPSIRFYEGMGARVMESWRICRLDQEGIRRTAERGDRMKPKNHLP